jgi:putative membrane protein
MIIKRNFNPAKVMSYVWPQMLLALLWSGVIYVAYVHLNLPLIALPSFILLVLGGALAIFLGFRNNTSYIRWGEASQSWAIIINNSRIFGRLIITFVDSHRHTPQYQVESAEAFKKEMLYRHLAWVNTLRLTLRGQMEWEFLRPFLSEAEYNFFLKKSNKLNYLLQLQGQRIYEAMATGTLQGFDSFQLEGCLAQLTGQQAICERLKTIPVPRQYDYFTRLFVWLFIILTPMCLVRTLVNDNVGPMLVPISLIFVFVFAVVERTGAVNEEPFENRITDVPLTAWCRAIERDLKELLGEENLPPKLEPQNGYLF